MKGRRSGARTPALLRASACLVLTGVLAPGLGCAPSGYYRSTTTSLDSLLTVQAQLQKRLDNLERRIELTREGVQATRASSDTRLTEMNQRMDMIQGKLEESGLKFTKLAMSVQGLRARDSARVAAGDAPVGGAIDPETAYQAAYSDFAAGRYNLAKDAFTEYLKRFPDTEVSDNAQYWIGECAYATGDFNGAIEAFKKVVSNYPKGDKVPAALLKTGIAYGRMKNMDEAKKYYNEVIQKYPRSDEARLARERLAQK